jgi:hypothetical protein
LLQRGVTRLQLTISVDFINFVVVTIGLQLGYIRLQFPTRESFFTHFYFNKNPVKNYYRNYEKIKKE